MADQDHTKLTPQELLDEVEKLVEQGIKSRTLFVTDAELIRRSGLPEKYARRMFQHLDGNKTSGFPRKLALFNNMRYWPAVLDWFDTKAGRKAFAKRNEDGIVENFGNERSPRRPRHDR